MSTPETSPPPLPCGEQSAALLNPWIVQQIKDGEHLRVLSICHYVAGALALLFSCFFLIYIGFGIMIIAGSGIFHPSPPTGYARSTLSPGLPVSPTPSAGATPFDPASRDLPGERARNDPPRELGYFVAGFGAIAVLLSLTLGALLIYSGRCLALRKHRTFSMVLAGISCLQVPFGTLLGVFTLVVLARPTVATLYPAGNRR